MSMTSTRITSAVIAGLLFGGLSFIGCGAGRTSIEGYDDAVLSGKRLFVLTPDEGEIFFSDDGAFAFSRGIAALNARERVSNEFQTQFRDRLDNLLDSNLVVTYRSQSVGAIHPLDASDDFTGEAGSWDWTTIDAARKEGAIDYLLVLQRVGFENQMPGDSVGRGKEKVTVDFVLIDPVKRSVMTRNQVSVSVKDPREVKDTYIKLVEELASKMPFYVKEN